MHDDEDDVQIGAPERPESGSHSRPRSHFHRQLSGWVFVDEQPPIETPGVPPQQDGGVNLWVIQRNPPDYPNKYVVRHWFVKGDDRWVDDQPLAVVDTLEAARRAIQPQQRVNLGPYKDGGDPSVCEAWM